MKSVIKLKLAISIPIAYASINNKNVEINEIGIINKIAIFFVKVFFVIFFIKNAGIIPHNPNIMLIIKFINYLLSSISIFFDGKICDWKTYGFLKSHDSFRFTIKDKFLETPIIDDIFKPIELETNTIEELMKKVKKQ